MLNDILSKLPPQAANPALLIGHETGDDAAVFKINDEQAVVAYFAAGLQAANAGQLETLYRVVHQYAANALVPQVP